MEQSSQEKAVAIGVDIGGTKIAVGIVDHSGNILSFKTFPTEAESGFDRAVVRISDCCKQLLSENVIQLSELRGIGIGCAGPVYPQKGIIDNPFTLTGWSNCDIVTPLNKIFGVPVILENDADMAALGEYYVGSGQGHDPMLMLTFGTGIGGAVIINGKIYRGADGYHPEIGHIYVGVINNKCYCGINGCFESIASGSGIAEAGKNIGKPSAEMVFDSAKNSDSDSLQIINNVKEAVAKAIWTYLHTFLPKIIVLGGGMVERHYSFFETAVYYAINNATQIPQGKITVAKAKLGNLAGMVGAGLSVLKLSNTC